MNLKIIRNSNPNVSVKQVVLEHSHTRLFTYDLRLLLYYKGQVEL